MSPIQITLIPVEEFDRVRNAGIDRDSKLALFADMCRANTLAMVKRAGSGHLGSSFSAMEIVVWLHLQEMNASGGGRDIYFSSKGHDVPGLYSVLFSLGVLPRDRFVRLRRLGGLDGHPDVGVPGIAANSGSLGMGISKGRGMAWAKQRRGEAGRVFVMLGDGELQEGQNYEALQAAVNQKVGNLIVIVDHNKVQSDKLVSEIGDLGDLEHKLRAFGWDVARCDGHDFAALERVLTRFRAPSDRPKLLIADTIKGRGVSFMEHPAALAANHGFYRWHAGAPPDQIFADAYSEILTRIESEMARLGLAPLQLETVEGEQVARAGSLIGEPVSVGSQKKLSEAAEYVADAYGQALVSLGAKHPNLLVLDADLSADCRIRAFEQTYPERFIQNGIAEQDMVSMAGGLARHGFLPVVNSFASFLASRANEQIYNNASERSKIIYAFHYAGMIPAGPGKSHQSIRDVSLVGALPNCVVIQPCNAVEAREATEWAVESATENVVLRMNIGPSPRTIELPAEGRLTLGRGSLLRDGHDATAIAYGPVMLHEVLVAAEILAGQGITLRVINLPWLNRLDTAWFESTVPRGRPLFIVEDHAPVGALGDFLRRTVTHPLEVIAVEGYPACGTPAEALAQHGLDGQSLARRFAQRITASRS